MAQVIISKTFLQTLVSKKVFSITYISSKGEERKMSCMFSVKKYFNNGPAHVSRPDDSVTKGYFKVFKMGRKTKEEMDKEEKTGKSALAGRYRTVVTSKIVSIRANGNEYSYADLVEMYFDYLATKCAEITTPTKTVAENGGCNLNQSATQVITDNNEKLSA